ncbi:MAG: hypothetical protein ABSA03_05275 [Streptosporangiaceae bacterium]|jgi:hypothetical protein
MLNDFTKIVSGAVTVLLAGGLALTAGHSSPAAQAASAPRHVSVDSSVSTPVASAVSAPLIGSSVTKSTLAQDTSEFGHLPIVRVFYTGMPAANAWTTGLAGENDSAVIVSFGADPAAILSGSDDAALTQFFDTAPTGHAIYYSYNHEPEVAIASGQYTAAAYQAAWAHVVALADQANNPDLHSTLILMAYDVDPASHRDWLNYLAPGDVISTLGWDAYPQGATDNYPLALTPPAVFMGPAVAASEAAGLPFGFSEFGTSLATGRAAWLTSVGSYLSTSGALFGSLFDTAGKLPSMRLTDTASITAWQSVVAQSDTANGITSTIRTHSSTANGVSVRIAGFGS